MNYIDEIMKLVKFIFTNYKEVIEIRKAIDWFDEEIELDRFIKWLDWYIDRCKNKKKKKNKAP